jgi:Flp pilus assembly protein CpaB
MQVTETVVPRAHARLRRLDLRVAVGLVLMLVAVLGGASLIRSAQERTPVLLVAGTVQPGEVIDDGDLRVAEVSLPAGVDYVPASMRGEIVGRVADEPLWEGKVLSSASLAEAPPLPAGTVAITLLLPAESALGGDVRAGDHVAVISSPAPDQVAAGEEQPTTILFPDVPILSVRHARTAEGQGLLVTLTLRLEEARALAEARSRGRVDLALLPGAAG